MSDISTQFDSMMDAIKAHLITEYNAKRITGAEYSQVYLGSMQVALQMATQAVKMEAEIAVLNQKLLTEKAQTEGTDASVQGVLGSQISLYKKQTEGYDRDAEQKAVKIMMDSFNTRISVGELLDDNGNEITDSKTTGTDIGAVVTKLRNNAGL